MNSDSLKKSKTLAITIITFLLIGCQSANLQTYSSDELTLEHPSLYSIIEPTDSLPVLTIQGETGRVEIFKTSDFDGERIHGYSSSGLEEFEAELVPKQKLAIDNFTIWLFYTQGDNQTAAEIHNIYESLTIN